MRFLLLRLFLLLCASTSALASDKALTSLNQFHQSLKQGDQKQVLTWLLDDALIYESGFAENKTEYASHHLAADIEFAKATQSTIKKSAIHCSDTQCVVTRESEITGEFKSKPVHSLTLETAVLVLHDGQWKIKHVHWSTRKAH